MTGLTSYELVRSSLLIRKDAISVKDSVQAASRADHLDKALFDREQAPGKDGSDGELGWRRKGAGHGSLCAISRARRRLCSGTLARRRACQSLPDRVR